MDRKDWTLLAIAAAEGEALDPAQLQKSLFVLGMERPEDVGSDYHRFSPYHYGPFASSVYHDADELEEEGFVSITRSGSVRKYRATDAGLQFAKALASEAPEGADYLNRVVQWARQLRFQALVRAIYAKYPEQRANSVFEG